jgi:superfamily II DNA or RNA helicase
MRLKVSEDKKFLILDDCTSLEYDQICSSFTKKIDNFYIIKKKFPRWNGEISFIDIFSRIPLGLWGEVRALSKKYNFPLFIDGADILVDKTFAEEDFSNWMNEFFPDPEEFTLRDYQVEACLKALKFRFCTEEISTSGGKTIIAYALFRYLFDRKKIKKMLYVVPNIDLVTQTQEKFYEYESRISDDTPPWKSQCVYSGAGKEKADVDIVFGTYQSLTKRSIEYFAQFDSILIDETHHAKADSIKNIVTKCYNATFYKIGLTGTLPKEGTCSSFTIQAYLGPKVFTLESAELIEAGNATPVNVICIELDYISIEKKKDLYLLRDVKADEKDGAKLLNIEKEIARNDRKRLVYICEMINKTKKNSLVLFADVKHEYGRKIYDWLRENTQKNVYYIDGNTKVVNRDFFKGKMENEEDTVLVASAGTFSEGIDLPNIHNLFITESHKSEIIIRQMLGRPMRLREGKDQVVVVDFSDNFFWNGVNHFQRKNYLMRHAAEREKTYKDKKFPFKKFKVKL